VGGDQLEVVVRQRHERDRAAVGDLGVHDDRAFALVEAVTRGAEQVVRRILDLQELNRELLALQAVRLHHLADPALLTTGLRRGPRRLVAARPGRCLRPAPCPYILLHRYWSAVRLTNRAGDTF